VQCDPYWHFFKLREIEWRKKSKKAKRGAPLRNKKVIKKATPARRKKKPAPKPARAPVAPSPLLEGNVWELYVKRLGLQHRPGHWGRTYGAYQVLINGEPVTSLSGHICECIGPGDNTAHGKKERLRIREGRYALSTQFGPLYCSSGFTDDSTNPMPGFLLLGTGARSAVLVHPGHPPDLYLSSIGCLNPAKPLKANEDMVFEESRARVIALIESLKQHNPAAFASGRIGQNTAIANAFIVVDGEPMTEVSDGAMV
jgi:hypothetical protein